MDKAKRNAIIKNIVIIILMIALWGLIVYFSIELGKKYIENKINDIEIRAQQDQMKLIEENKTLNERIDKLNTRITDLKDTIVNLNDDIDAFSSEVKVLEGSIESINAAVAGSASVQLELGKKINTLDKRLSEMKKSLKMLLEAPSE